MKKILKLIVIILVLMFFSVLFDMVKINSNYLNKPLVEISRYNINSSIIKDTTNNIQKLNIFKKKEKKHKNFFNHFNFDKDIIIKKVNLENFKAFSQFKNEINLNDWTRSHGNNQSNRFSDLEYINKSNVKNLKKIWEFSIDRKFNRDVQCNPIVKRGIIYSATNAGSIIALEGATGKLVWETKGFSQYVARRGMLITSNDKIFFSDNKYLVSLNASNGYLNKNFGKKGKVKLDGSSVVAPVIYKNLILTVTFDKTIEAFNKSNGKTLWKYSFEDPKNKKLVNDQIYFNSGGNPWGGISLDKSRGILFITTGNPSYYFDGTRRPGLNKYSNSVIAFDIKQKKIIWDFQEVFHDIWNLDIPAPPILSSVILKNKKKLDVVIAVTKLGNTLILDRETGEPLHNLEYQTAPKSKLDNEVTSKFQISKTGIELFSKNIFNINDITNRDEINEDYILNVIKNKTFGFFETFEIGKKNILYNFHGGAEWPGASVDHDKQILYVTSNDIPWIGGITYVKNNEKKIVSSFERLKDLDGYPGTKPPWGKITAIDLNSGKILWQKPFGDYDELNFKGQNGDRIETGTENFGGVTGSAGGILFATGTLDHKFYVYDSSNGKKLFETLLPYVGSAPPTTYMVNGKQYVVIVSTGSLSLKTGYPEKLEYGNKIIAYSVK